MAIHWHRRDLRAADNVGLARGAEAGDVVPVFVFDPAVLAHGSPVRVAFMRDALDALRAWYRERGSDLLVERGDPSEVIPRLADAHDADVVTWGRDYTGLAKRRDRAVRAALEDRDVSVEAVIDAVLHEPGTITTNEGTNYQVYTYFWKKWRDREKPAPASPPDAEALADVDGSPLPTLADLDVDQPSVDPPPASTEAARQRLAAFCEGPIERYAERRDYPAERPTSRLSAHLSMGTIGVREVYAATQEALARANGEDAVESVREFQSQLAWREFYTQVLDADPAFVEENHQEFATDIQWRNDSEEIAAWKAGETGYPIVDAGMRQLRQEAFMHNRVRMIVASFLTKDLLADWRIGLAWFKRHLVDHDPANDAGGWQWAASTGTDAQPYFRVFNPTTQGERYDPDAEYITRYVPELRGVDPETIHGWPDLDPTFREAAAPAYPAPIVDHGERREAAIAAFEAARGED
jgi:deoxyribodipyrimidine photo-lyase